MRNRRTLATLVGAAVVAAAGSLAFGSLTRADAADAGSAGLVEDYSYPGAAAIEASQHIKLISGDGHIMLAPCGSEDNLIQVESYNNVDEAMYCFKVIGSTGRLELQIPKVFFVWAGDEAVTAKVTVNGTEQPPVTVAAGDGEPVGAEDRDNHAVLLELKV